MPASIADSSPVSRYLKTLYGTPIRPVELSEQDASAQTIPARPRLEVGARAAVACERPWLAGDIVQNLQSLERGLITLNSVEEVVIKGRKYDRQHGAWHYTVYCHRLRWVRALPTFTAWENQLSVPSFEAGQAVQVDTRVKAHKSWLRPWPARTGQRVRAVIKSVDLTTYNYDWNSWEMKNLKLRELRSIGADVWVYTAVRKHRVRGFKAHANDIHAIKVGRCMACGVLDH